MRPAPTPDTPEYYAYPRTTLGPTDLVEIGRVMAHHGLLVMSAREFVVFVAEEVPGFPGSISSEDSIKLLPQAIDAIKFVLPVTKRNLLSDLLNQVANVQYLLDRFRYSTWGGGGGTTTRHEYRQYRGLGCNDDRTVYTSADLYNWAMEISSVTLSIRKVHGLLYSTISDEPSKVRRQLARTPQSRTRALRESSCAQ